MACNRYCSFRLDVKLPPERVPCIRRIGERNSERRLFQAGWSPGCPGLRLRIQPGQWSARFRQSNEINPCHMLMSRNFPADFIRRSGIDIQHRDGIAPALLSAESQVGNIDFVSATDGSNEADQPGFVFVSINQHLPVKVRVELFPVLVGVGAVELGPLGAASGVAHLIAVGVEHAVGWGLRLQDKG